MAYLDVAAHTLLDGSRDELGVEKKLVDLHGHGEQVRDGVCRCKRVTMRQKESREQ